MERTLSIVVRCEHCGVDSDKPVSVIRDGVRVWVPPIFMEMQPSAADSRSRPSDGTQPWHLCLKCWVSGMPNKSATATAIVEPAPAA
jgi:hypothetical protein